jgi:hypothetical protein
MKRPQMGSEGDARLKRWVGKNKGLEIYECKKYARVAKRQCE